MLCVFEILVEKVNSVHIRESTTFIETKLMNHEIQGKARKVLV
jgi:hypothetical protein